MFIFDKIKCNCMERNLLFSPKFKFTSYLSFLLFFIFSTAANAQCAGEDNVLSVCDIATVSSQNIDLNLSLLGIPTIGGTWHDEDNSGGLDPITGILNAQKVYKSGVYHYTYIVDGIVGCTDNNAVIEVTIGGYAGVPGPSNSICSSDNSYSLFQVFQGIPVLAPQSGGIWNDDDNSKGLNPVTGILNAAIPVPGQAYSYTYTIPKIGSCPAVSKQISVSIYRSPEPGFGSNLSLCSNQLGAYKNVDLLNQLSGEDSGGVWTEGRSNEITYSTDSTIDIQNIYNTKGPGNYPFTYTVLPPKNDRVCTNKSTRINVAIGEQLDFTEATLTVNPDSVCENNMANATYTGILTQGVRRIANGNYRVNYTVSGVGTFSTVQDFVNGVLIFPIPSSYFPDVRNYVITVLDVTLTSSPVFCSSIVGQIQDVITIFPSPKIDTATLTIPSVCQGGSASVNFSGTSNLSNGSYDIIYNLSGDNVLNGIPSTMIVTGGISDFIIPAAYLSKIGTTTITITKISNSLSGCSNTAVLSQDFIVNPSLDLTTLTVAANNACKGNQASVILSGFGLLTDLDITYNLTGSNTATSKTVSIVASSGQGTLIIPSNDIPNTGVTNVSITNITNTITGCTFVANNKRTSFTVIAPPNIPIAADQAFCSADNATVNNLIPNGTQYKWLDTATSTAPLANTTLLQSGTYFVKEVNPTSGCQSASKMINVLINSNPEIDNARLFIATTCQSYDVSVLLAGSSNLANGVYNILYDLTGDNTGTAIAAELTFTNGIGVFSIPTNFAPNEGTTTVSITDIKNSITGCANKVNLNKSFTTNPAPDITNMLVTIKDICEGQLANVQISGLESLTEININFELLGSNTVRLKTIPLNIVKGSASFDIPAVQLVNTGLTTFNMTNITNRVNGCPISMDYKTNFMVNELPNVTTIAISINDGCPNQPLDVTVSGLGNQNDVVFTYTIAGANTLITQTPVLSVIGGNTSFTIPATALITTGANTIVFTNLENSVTGCSTVINSISENFTILPIPNNPIADNQGFCKEDLATVANLLPNDSAYKWFDSENSIVELALNTLLTTATYYLKEISSTTGCASNATAINVAVNTVAKPTLQSDSEEFCGADKPTIQDLSNKTNHTGVLTWYTAPTSGIAFANTDYLTEGTSYYGIDYNTVTKCISEAVEATITLKICNRNPDGLAIPDGFSPNGDGVNDTFKIMDIEYLFPNFSLEIYNRYGNIMFKGNINKPDWDGKNANSSFINGDAGTGVYFYIINYNKDNFSPRQGQLYLNR